MLTDQFHQRQHLQSPSFPCGKSRDDERRRGDDAGGRPCGFGIREAWPVQFWCRETLEKLGHSNSWIGSRSLTQHGRGGLSDHHTDAYYLLTGQMPLAGDHVQSIKSQAPTRRLALPGFDGRFLPTTGSTGARCGRHPKGPRRRQWFHRAWANSGTIGSQVRSAACPRSDRSGGDPRVAPGVESGMLESELSPSRLIRSL
jgi:hypothetical protein